MSGYLRTLKYKARINLVPNIARVANFFGIPYQRLGETLGREVLLAQARDFVSTEPPKNADPLRVSFLTMIGGHTYNSAVDVVLALTLKNRGHEVEAIVCDKALPLCDSKKAANESEWPRICEKCWSYGNRLMSSYNIPVTRVSEIIASDSSDHRQDWPDEIESSLLKHFGVGVLDENDHRLAERRAMFQKSAAMSETIGAYLVKQARDRVIMSHGIYTTWGPARLVLNSNNVPVVTYSKTKKANAEKFNWSTGGDWWDVSDEWEKVKQKPLTSSQQKLIDDYLESRRSHSKDTLVYNFGAESDRNETFENLGLNKDLRTFTLFTNVLWDAASAQREIAFSNPIDWVIQTIRWFLDKPHLQLIVKVHPAEVVIGTNQPFAQVVREHFPSLPKHIRIIEPHEKVNSWSIIGITDLGIVHTSTVGMELPLEGVPCMVVSKTHFRGKGFTIDIDSKEEYFELLSDWNAEGTDEEKNRIFAERYAYLLFERYQLPFHVFIEPSHTNVVALKHSTIEELANYKTMQLVTRAIEDKDQFLMPEDATKHWS